MGLLSGIFNDKKDKKRLVSVVAKIENSPLGEFVNIATDLISYTDKVGGDSDTILRMMAVTYARRIIMACLYFQGIMDREGYDAALQVCKLFQNTVGQTVEFQEKATEQALELIKSYNISGVDDRLLNYITYVVENGLDMSMLKGKTLSVSQMVALINKMMREKSM